MKLKNCFAGVVSVCALTIFAGCYEPLELTESELDMVAEYAAGVLVEHGTKSTDTLLNRNEQEEAFAAMATPTPRPTLAPVSNDKKPSMGENQSDSQDTPVTAKPTPTAVPDNSEVTMKDLTELIGKEDFFFNYVGHKTTALYQGAGDLFAAAGEGKQLIVLEFEVTNQSGAESALVLNKGAAKEFIYTLRIGNKSIRPSLTLLGEDFYTSYDVTFKPGETKKCVLVFECAKSTELDDVVLTVLRDVDGKEDSVLIKVK